jgi:cell division protease FtsH
MSVKWRHFVIWPIVILLVLAVFALFENPRPIGVGQEISFSQMLKEVDQGQVRDVTVQGSQINGTFTNGRRFYAYALVNAALLQQLHDKGVLVTVRPPEENVPWYVSLVVSWLPFIALIGVWIFLSRQMMQKRKEKE